MLTDQLKKFAKFAWFLPGFLLWAAFPPMGEGTDVLFALAPLLWVSRRENAKRSAWRWFQNGLFFWIATLSWMPAIVKNGGPWPLVVLGWFALAAYCAGYFALYGYLTSNYWQWAKSTEVSRYAAYLRLGGVLVVEPILWCGLELVRSRFLGGFAWNQLGVVPCNLGFGAPAALGGVYLCSAVVILINGTFAGIAERVWKVERSGFPGLRKFGSLETLMAFAMVAGIYSLAKIEAEGRRDARDESDPRDYLKVALVQRNFPCVFQEKEENPYLVYSNLLQNVAALKPDLVVLSESAMCEFGPIDQQGAMRFARFVRAQTGGAALFAGGTRYADGKTFNSAALYSETTLSVYDKVHLVPFGEFVPGDKWFPFLQKLAPVGSCTPGEPRPLVLPTAAASIPPMAPIPPIEPISIPLGVAICFEDTDSALMRKQAAMGARALLFITNDSWFSKSDETLAHAWQATARAIETGLPVVRVGNSGVTGTITPEGQATWLLAGDGRPLVDRRGTMLDRVRLADPNSPQTFYVRFGDIPLVISFLLLITAMFLVKYTTHYGKHRTLSL